MEAQPRGVKRIPWTTLPRAHSIHLYEWELGANARVWIKAGVEDKEFHEWQFRALAALGGDAHGGSYGSGAWEEGKPWAHLVSDATFSMEGLYKAKGWRMPKPDFDVLRERWARALERLESHCRACLPEGRWLISSWEGSPGNTRVPTEAESKQMGEAMMAIQEAMDLEALVVPAARRASKAGL